MSPTNPNFARRTFPALPRNASQTLHGRAHVNVPPVGPTSSGPAGFHLPRSSTRGRGRLGSIAREPSPSRVTARRTCPQIWQSHVGGGAPQKSLQKLFRLPNFISSAPTRNQNEGYARSLHLHSQRRAACRRRPYVRQRVPALGYRPNAHCLHSKRHDRTRVVSRTETQEHTSSQGLFLVFVRTRTSLSRAPWEGTSTSTP